MSKTQFLTALKDRVSLLKMMNISFHEDLDPTERNPDGLKFDLYIKLTVDSLDYFAACIFEDEDYQVITPNDVKNACALTAYKDSVFLDTNDLIKKLNIDLIL
jgi:hypothetical protein